MWTVNHIGQRLAGPDLAASQVMEFGLSLDGPPATWFKAQPLTTFTTFDNLVARFKKLFQRHEPLKQLSLPITQQCKFEVSDPHATLAQSSTEGGPD